MTRTVGIEVELARLTLEQTLEIVQSELGGTVRLESRAEGSVEGTRFGKFHVEFDHSILKQRSYLRPLERLGLIESEDSEGAQRVEASVLQVAAEIVPIEVVTPPIPWDRMVELDGLWAALRAAHAADTHGSLLYAFGLHFNPEVPDGQVETLLASLRAFLLLEDLLVARSDIDLSRRISPFIRSFPEAYRRKVLELAYEPTLASFVDDFLEHNPTRNRPLDLCPLFMHLLGPSVLERIHEAHLVKGRPTFHYRLPNCELAQPGWTPAEDWNRWIALETVAENRPLLTELSRAYLETADMPLRLQKDEWVRELERRLPAELLR